MNCESTRWYNLRKVAELNNVGVSCFETKKYQQAVSQFREALQSITAPTIETQEVSAQEQATFDECSSKTLGCNDPCAPILKAQVPREDTSTDSQCFLCFAQAMEIVSSPTAYSENPNVNEVLVSAMIIWNMAVVYHTTSYGVSERLERAYALYMKSWSLLENLVCNGSTGNHMIDFFTQALLNNLGGCCQALNQYSDARMWSDHLISYAQTIGVDNQEEEEEREVHDSNVAARLQEQTNHFVLNAIMRMQCRPSFLASAA